MPQTSSQRIELKPHHLTEFLKIAGTAEGGLQYITDTTETGLSLRLKGQKVSWMLRYKGNNWTIGWTWEGEPWHIPNVKSGRELAAAVKDQYEYGGDPCVKEYLRLWHDNNKRKKEDRLSHDQLVKQMRPKTNSWTLRECMEKTIADRADPKAKKTWRDSHADGVRRDFNRPEFSHLLDTEVTNLRPEDIESGRELLLSKNSSASVARKAVSHISTVLTHCKQKYGGLSGMNQIQYPWWKEIKVDRVDPARTRQPRITELAKTLILVDLYTSKRLPGRIQGTKDSKHGVRNAVACAFFWIVLTAQRANAGLSLERLKFVADDKNDGWYLAAWDAASMKGRVDHVLPIPPRLVDFMLPRLEKIDREDSDWLFPSERGKKDIHVNRSSTLAVLERLSATDDLGKKRRDSVDLLQLNGIRYWAMHDVRRSIAETLEAHGIPAGSSAILAHDLKVSERLNDGMSVESKEELQKQMVAKITKLAYGGAQHLKIKRQAMSIWVDTVLDEYERLKTTWTPLG